MATKNFQFFVSVNEIADLLKNLVTKFGLWLVFYTGGVNPQLVLAESLEALDELQNGKFVSVYLTSTKPDMSKVDAADFAPAQLGWLQVDLPKEDGTRLYLSELTVKTDWFDRYTNKIMENHQLEKLFSKIRRELKKDLKSPIWAKNIKTQGVSCYKDMAYSEAVEDWEKKGGELLQQGVENVRFSTSEL